MGISEAKKYIQDLHLKQNNPYLWPDYLTGLPDKAAIISKLDEVLPEIGKYSVTYIRIGKIESYLMKYGHSMHAEIIQWTAAVLKTTADKFKMSFVGVMSSHDFIVICLKKDSPSLIREAEKLFDKKIASYYKKEDLNNKTTISSGKGKGSKIRIELMRFITVIADRELNINKGVLVRNMGRICDEMQRGDQNIIVLDKSMIE